MTAAPGRATAAEPSDSEESVVAPQHRERFRLLLPGAYAWLLTVLYPVLKPGAPLAARLTAFAALSALLAATLVPNPPSWLMRALGVYGFVGLSLVTWALSSDELSVARLDPLRAALGVLGWVIFAFGWGRARAGEAPEHEPNLVPGAPLLPRSRLPRRTVPLVGFAVATALLLEALAFRVDRPEHALFAHATATACALLVLGAGTRLALGSGPPRQLSPPAARLNATAPPLALLAVLLGAGLVLAAFSR